MEAESWTADPGQVGSSRQSEVERAELEEGNGFRLSSGAHEEDVEAEVRLSDSGGRVKGARGC
jgi:hypothetical protein